MRPLQSSNAAAVKNLAFKINHGFFNGHANIQTQCLSLRVKSRHNAVVKPVLGVPNASRQVGVASTRNAVNLQHLQGDFASVVLATTCIVEENAAGFLFE